MISVHGKVENTVGKGENAGYQHSFLLLQFFPRPSLRELLKVGILWYRVKVVIVWLKVTIDLVKDSL